MNLKLWRNSLILSIVALTPSILPNVYSEELQQSSDKHLTTGFPLEVAAKANERAELLIKTVEALNAGPRDHDASVKEDYQVSYDNDGYINEIIYPDGFMVQLSYEKDETGEISGVSFAMADSSLTIQVDVNDKTASHSNDFDSTAKSMDREPKIELEDSGLDKLLRPKTQDLPLKITIKARSGERSFGQLLSALKKGANSPATSALSSIDFPALKQIFHNFKKNQEIAFNQYTAQTQTYYDTLAPLLKDSLSASPGAPHANVEVTSRRAEIDDQVDRLLSENRGNSDPQSIQTKITGLQPMLSDLYITPNRERLRKTVENNISTLQKSLYEMLILGGTTTIIHTDETSTEIIILLQ